VGCRPCRTGGGVGTALHPVRGEPLIDPRSSEHEAAYDWWTDIGGGAERLCAVDEESCGLGGECAKGVKLHAVSAAGCPRRARPLPRWPRDRCSQHRHLVEGPARTVDKLLGAEVRNAEELTDIRNLRVRRAAALLLAHDGGPTSQPQPDNERVGTVVG